MALDLARQPIRTMEPVIIERLRLAFPQKDFTVERIPQTLTLKEFERLSRLTPFIGLAWTGFKPDGDNNRITKGAMLWRLVLLFKASNALETRFKGDTRGLGLDAMVDVAMVLMNGAEYPGIGTSHVTLANSVIADGWTDDSIVIAQVDFEVRFTATPATFKLKTLEDFQALGVTWIVNPPEEETPPETGLPVTEDTFP
ncbi:MULTISPECIES: hypothetical protein [unclassified Shinella]|uniref:hypothetical protein n=1 Tax=unclassified Shinella TaxID=2643062 RepID=UPI00067FD46D|nr:MULTISPECIES: hypothetical protein [unclassified Shinella]